MRSSQSVSKVNHIHALFFTDKSFIWSSEAIDSGATTKWGNVTFLRDGKKVEKQTVASRLRKKSDAEDIDCILRDIDLVLDTFNTEHRNEC